MEVGQVRRRISPRIPLGVPRGGLQGGEECATQEDDRHDDHRRGGAERGHDDAHAQQRIVIAPEISVGGSAARCPVRQASSLDIVTRVRMPARSFRPSCPFAARHVNHITRTAPPISTTSADTIAPGMVTTLACWYMNGNVPRGQWRASLRTTDGWQSVREPAGRYAEASLLEWGSITKGLVGTTAAVTLELGRPVASYLPGVPDGEMTVGDLVRHTSGLARVPPTIRDSIFRDPYRPAVGVPLDLTTATPVTPRGQYVYSNLGYASSGRSSTRCTGAGLTPCRSRSCARRASIPQHWSRLHRSASCRGSSVARIRPWALGCPRSRRPAGSGRPSTTSAATPTGRWNREHRPPARSAGSATRISLDQRRSPGRGCGDRPGSGSDRRGAHAREGAVRSRCDRGGARRTGSAARERGLIPINATDPSRSSSWTDGTAGRWVVSGTNLRATRGCA